MTAEFVEASDFVGSDDGFYPREIRPEAYGRRRPAVVSRGRPSRKDGLGDRSEGWSPQPESDAPTPQAARQEAKRQLRKS